MIECPSRFSLAQMRAGDLADKVAMAFRAHVAACPKCQGILENVDSNALAYESRAERNTAQIASRLNELVREPENLRVEDRFGRARRRGPAIALFAPLAAAAAIALLLSPSLFQRNGEKPPIEGEPAVKFKGTAMTFNVVAKRDERQFKVEPGAVLMPDDALRFVVNTESSGYLSVFSIDEQNRISPFYPETDPDENPEPMMLSAAGRHELPGSIVLDNVRGAEYYVVVFSKNRFDRRDVHARLRQERVGRETAPPNGPDLFVRSLRVEKRPK